jgi:thiamine-phosphate pyrophosphorylase
VRHAAAHARVPWFAIGGIDAGTVREVVEAGATRVVVVRAIAEAPDPAAATAALRAALPHTEDHGPARP